MSADVLPAWPDAGWIRSGYLETPVGLCLSFQRYRRTSDERVPHPLPSSLGALPCALASDGSVLIPLAAGEAFWIGLRQAGTVATVELSLTAVSRNSRARPVHFAFEAPSARLEGYPDAAGTVFSFGREVERPFGASGFSRLECRTQTPGIEDQAAACSFVLRLVDPETFAAKSGRAAPQPLDPAAGYRSQLLP